MIVNDVEMHEHPEYPGYYAGCNGSVYCDRPLGRYPRPVNLRKVSPWMGSVGYLQFKLCFDAGDGIKHKNMDLHKFIITAFKGPRPEAHDIRHLDGSKTNNYISNLEYGTRSQNMNDARNHGTIARGNRHGIAKLKETDIPVIFELRESGLSHEKIAKQFGVSRKTISAVLSGETWGWLK